MPTKTPDNTMTTDTAALHTCCIRQQRDEIRERLAELDAARRDAWLPIESAPRDGKQGRMLLAWADGTVEQGMFVNNETWQGFRPESLRPWPDGQPTHWRPLPAPPADAAMAREAG